MVTKQLNPEKLIVTTATWIYVNELTGKVKRMENDLSKKQRN